ncbi:serine-type D-Ala-D-Ala endopeptidase (penicillin-binding protein 7) [Janthinobacterium sp. CG_23.3]|uniref:serine hydrolase n=1 Tax=unclassified Janthinobacterium TaxID=2610881 RepID=UPI00034D95F2|nr:serine hydrolase [Janthinobacterium sp. CG3]
MFKKIIAVVLASLTSVALAVPLGSQSVLVVEDGTGKILVEKNSNVVVPIASLTKLMTAMVVLDSKPDMNAPISIDKNDVDMLKHSTSRVPVGATLSRQDMLQLALMSSDNRAAAALGRTYPGGPTAFALAVNAKIKALGMTQTVIEEPTGLSPNNRSTAADLIKMAVAASTYADIRRITTDSEDVININGRQVQYHNSNRLVGAKGWEIGLSKTGYTEEAGRCLIMRFKSAGRNATLVLLNARANSARVMDALNIRRFIAGDEAEPKVMKVSLRKQRLISAGGSAKPVVLKASPRKKTRIAKAPSRRVHRVAH